MDNRKSLTGADDLIGKAMAREAECHQRMPPEARAEVEKIIAYNRTAGKNGKVPIRDVIAMLDREFGVVMSNATIRRWCFEVLGHGFSQ